MLGSLLSDDLRRLDEARSALEHAISLNASSANSYYALLFLRRDILGEGEGALPVLEDLRKIPNLKESDEFFLHEALFAAHAKNWGIASDALEKAFSLRTEWSGPDEVDDWLKASAVLLHLNFGSELLTFFNRQADTVARLRPWVEALRAHVAGDRRYLQNIAPEIRATAEELYDGIERRLQNLPEKTRRRQLPKVKHPPAGRKG